MRATSGREPLRSLACPISTSLRRFSDSAASPVNGSRSIVTAAIPVLSRAHPSRSMAFAASTSPPAGLSNQPNGAFDWLPVSIWTDLLERSAVTKFRMFQGMCHVFRIASSATGSRTFSEERCGLGPCVSGCGNNNCSPSKKSGNVTTVTWLDPVEKSAKMMVRERVIVIERFSLHVQADHL